MTKPQAPGISAVTDTFDFVKNLWGMMGVPGMNMPGMVVPTLSVDELDKKIADLKAVESWLNVNMGMLRGTIQALEVQRATIATLKAMGESFGEAVNKSQSADNPSSRPSKPASAFPDFTVPPSTTKTQGNPDQTVASERSAETFVKQSTPDASAQIANPALWWNVLQDQFKQAVGTAMASETAPKRTVETPGASKKAVTPRAKKTVTKRSAKAKAAVTKPKAKIS